ncbi:MAG: amidohydrolase family protein [Pseudomonadota bacterium]
MSPTDTRTFRAPSTPPRGHLFEPGRSYVILSAAAWLGPGLTRSPSRLIVRNGLLVEPEATDRLDEAELIDLGAVLVVPGLVDSHAHLALDPGGWPEFQDRVRLAAAWGLAGIRDGGDRNSEFLGPGRDPDRPLIIASPGPALFRPGRYGAFLGRPVEGLREIVAAVRDVARAGADYIKVLASGPVGLKYFGQVGAPQFGAGELAALVGAAKDQGLEVMAHANGPEAVEMCLRAGVGSLEHGYFMGRKAMAMLSEKQIPWIPTIVPLSALAASPRTAPEQAALIESIIAAQVAELALARELGVKTALGSDAGSPGNPAGPSLFGEMRFFSRAGFSAEDILVAAVTRGAELMGAGRKLGRLAPGRPARLVGFDFNSPLERALAAGPVFTARPARGVYAGTM